MMDGIIIVNSFIYKKRLTMWFYKNSTKIINLFGRIMKNENNKIIDRVKVG
jgi:hypothetical protein